MSAKHDVDDLDVQNLIRLLSGGPGGREHGYPASDNSRWAAAEALGARKSDIAVEALIEALARDIRHHDEVMLRVALEAINGADVRVIQGTGGLSFSLKPGPRSTVTEGILGEKLQRHCSAKKSILGLVHRSHPTFPQLAEHLVVRDGLADHGRFLREQGSEVCPADQL